MKGNRTNIIIRVSLFIIIGTVIFYFCQRILSQNWNRPYFAENVSASLRTFYSQEKDSDQVLFFGTSHSEFCVSPMEIYEDSGIAGYNLSTSGQPIEVSYYLLRSALETQTPKAVVIDASSLFFDDSVSTAAWRYVLDGMPFGRNKLAMARMYSILLNETDTNRFTLACERDLINALVPMFMYHTRWNELSAQDFHDVWFDHAYAAAGYFMNTYRSGSISIEDMNNSAAALRGIGRFYETTYTDGSREHYESEDCFYSAEITDRKRMYLDIISNLCESKGVVLVLAKYPSIYDPIYYSSAWTEERSAVIKQLAQEMGIEFLDFVYDIDCGFDYTADFSDAGMHCNYLGARKISLYLSNYLKNTLELKPQINAQFEANRELYDKLTEIAQLQLGRSCSDIMDYIAVNKDKYIICISAQDDMVSSIGDEEISGLHALGLKADYRKDMTYSDSYAAIIDRGRVVVEKLSNRRIEYETAIEDCGDEAINIRIVSSGNYNQSYSQINVNGTDYALNTRGINVVLIDAQTHAVVMSKAIDTWQDGEEHNVNSADDLKLLQDYWEEMLK